MMKKPERTSRGADDQPSALTSRRHWLAHTGTAAVAVLVPAHGLSGQEKNAMEEEEVAPPEDLMREHGVLNRILLVYDEVILRIGSKKDLPPDAVKNSAAIIRSFIEDYHEKLEEDYLFPRFEKAGRLTDLTRVLRAQHQAGRRLTDQVTQLASLSVLKDPARSATLKATLEQFIRMYRPHEAREDTVLFPALRSIVSAQEFAELGEEFERKEHALFGDDGFEKIVDRVASIEKALGVYELAQFTPRA
jgi:hemerythrin-like domain-containing protein